MAGLITPEIIPFINNEEKLGLYLDQKNVNYLMTFSDWYPNLIEKGNEIYRSDSRFSPDAGGGNMIVIKWVSK
jgi:hypothetical protein